MFARSMGHAQFAFGLCQHEGTLDNCLYVASERGSGYPACAGLGNCCGKISLQRRSIAHDAGVAGG